MSQQIDFSEIAPFTDSQFRERMTELVEEPGLNTL